MFVDQADIQVLAGDGGNGCVSFRREKYIPHGGPDGGDGGRGGSVYLEATPGVDTLLDMVGRHHWYAQRGQHGMGKKKAGSDGGDLIIRVPPGTLIYDSDSKLLLADLKQPGKRVCVAQGGKGGRGNMHFATSVRQAPDFAEPGGKGVVRTLHLELRLIADVGLVGLPNAGKSTLLSHISAARPKIADYPFTTLVPQLGIAELDAERRLVIADIPGLIEGAHEGHGLGLDFLRHIERTRVIVHLLDVLPLDGSNPVDSYRQIRAELEAYSPRLAAKAEILVANKMDLAGAAEALADIRSAMPGKQILAISAVAGTGLRPMLETVWQQVEMAPPSEPFVDAAPILLLQRDEPVERPEEEKFVQVSPEELPDENAWEAADGGEITPEPDEAPKQGKRRVPESAKMTEGTAAHKPKSPAKRAAKKARAMVLPRKAKKPAPPKPAEEMDAALLVEIEAMKADDLRKGKYYTRKTP